MAEYKRLSRTYTAIDRGFKEIAMGPKMKKVSLDVGKEIAGNANAVGESTYDAESTIVRAGWNNETRQGAVVKETKAHWRDARDAILVRVTRSMQIRNRR